jgi:hypothetical protein
MTSLRRSPLRCQLRSRNYFTVFAWYTAIRYFIFISYRKPCACAIAADTDFFAPPAVGSLSFPRPCKGRRCDREMARCDLQSLTRYDHHAGVQHQQIRPSRPTGSPTQSLCGYRSCYPDREWLLPRARDAALIGDVPGPSFPLRSCGPSPPACPTCPSRIDRIETLVRPTQSPSTRCAQGSDAIQQTRLF